MSSQKAKDRHTKLMDGLDLADETAPGIVGLSRKPHPDSSVPALGTTGDLLRAELAASREQVDALTREVGDLRAAPAERKIPARLIRHGKFRDRHELGFEDAKFEELKASIKSKGGNKQSVLVRPLPKPDADGREYEVVWGHRRHWACFELGLDVNVIVRELSDREAVELMTIENKFREDLSQYELARRYKIWLDEGLYESQQAIAEREGLNQATISRIMTINELPEELVDRVDDPRKIKGVWAAKVVSLVKKDRAGVLKRIGSAGGKLTPKALMDLIAPPAASLEPRDISVDGRRVFQAMEPSSGGSGEVTWTTLKLCTPLDDSQLEKLAAFAATL